MKCKNCESGFQLKTLAHRKKDNSVLITLDPVGCDCCGGYFEYCENCKQGRRVYEWVDEKDYPAALEGYKRLTERPE